MSSAGLAIRAADGGRASLLMVRAQPGARRSGIAGTWNGALRLAVAAPALDGRANEALRALLCQLLGLRPSGVELVRGQTARSKVFRVALAPETLRARLEALAP